jgi:hypothetical protein
MVYRGPDGRYFTGACVDFNEFVPAVRNGVATVAAAAGSLRVAAQAAERLGRDPELAAQWREIADGLQRNAPVNRRGALAEYEGDDGVSMTSLRIVATSLSNGLIPARDPVVGRTLKLLYGECKTAENWTVSAPQDPELHRRVAGPRSPDASAWTWPAAEMVGVAAAAGDGEMAAAVVRELIRCSGNFGSLYECKVMRDGFVSLPWFVTSDAELSASISMMLLQCEGDRIELLPGVPQAWKNLRFRLAAPNRTAVEAEVEGGVLKALRITGPMGTRTLRVPRRFKAERLLGAPSAETSEHHEFAVRVAPLGSPPDRGP